MSYTRHLTKLTPHRTLFLCCDVQEKFRKAIPLFSNLVENITKLIRVGRVFNVPLIATEQYPKGLGPTVKELIVSDALAVIPKTEFSMYQPELCCYMKELLKEKPKDVVLFGIETHINVLQTSMDFLEHEYRVHVVADCVASRTNQDRDMALHLMRQIGCFVQTSESIIFNLLQDKDNPKFDDVKHAVKSVSSNMGLAKKKDRKIGKAAKKKPDKKKADKKKADKKKVDKKVAKKASAKKVAVKKSSTSSVGKTAAKKKDPKKKDSKAKVAKKKDSKTKVKDVKKKDSKAKVAKKKDSKAKVAKKNDSKKKDDKNKKSGPKKPSSKKPPKKK